MKARKEGEVIWQEYNGLPEGRVPVTRKGTAARKKSAVGANIKALLRRADVTRRAVLARVGALGVAGLAAGLAKSTVPSHKDENRAGRTSDQHSEVISLPDAERAGQSEDSLADARVRAATIRSSWPFSHILASVNGYQMGWGLWRGYVHRNLSEYQRRYWAEVREWPSVDHLLAAAGYIRGLLPMRGSITDQKPSIDEQGYRAIRAFAEKEVALLPRALQWNDKSV